METPKPKEIGSGQLSEFSFYELRKTQHLTNIGLILLVSFLLNFVFFHFFGMYADDWAYLGQVFRFPYTLKTIEQGMFPYADGRPLQYLMDAAVGNILFYTRSLSACYLFTWAMAGLALVSLYVMLLHRFTAFFSLLVTILFSISPLYSIKPFLNGESGFALAFIFLFVGGMFCFRGKYLMAYVCGALSLLTYELFFPIFVFIPILLRPITTKRDLKRFFLHFAVCVGLVIAFAIFKDHYGTRTPAGLLGDASSSKLLLGILSIDARYTIDGLWGLFDIPLWLHKLHRWDALVWMVIATIASFVYLRSKRAELEASVFRKELPGSKLELGILALGFVISGYSLVYFAITGNTAAKVASFLDRISRFHIASSFGGSLLTAVLLLGLFSFDASTTKLSVLRAGLVAVYLGLLAGFSVSHQSEFALAATQQRQLVEQLIALHPAMDPQDTFVIYRPDVPSEDELAIGNEAHGYYFLLKYMFVWPGPLFPPSGPAIRIVHDPDWADSVLIDAAAGNVSWPGGIWPATPEKTGHIWFYDQLSNGTLQLHAGATSAEDRHLLRDSPGTSLIALSTLPRQPFYTDVLAPSFPTGSEEQQMQALKLSRPGRPKIDSVAPSSGGGPKQNFVARLSDTKDPHDLSGVYFMFQTSVQPAHSCWVYIDLAAKTYNLAQDDGSHWMAASKFGAGALANSQCSISGEGARIELKENEVEVTAPIEFKPEFSGAKKIYVWVRTAQNVDSGWREEGSWTVSR